MARPIAKLKSSTDLLKKILDQPDLPDVIRHLDGDVLSRLIHHVGLEDSAAIVAYTSADQLGQVFDEDLWKRKKPGQDDFFDGNRFGVWLEILMENGAACAVEKIMEMDENLVALGLFRHIRVKRLEDTWGYWRDDNGDRKGGGKRRSNGDRFRLTFWPYGIIAKNTPAIGTVCEFLAELSEREPDKLYLLLDRCCGLTEDNKGGFGHRSEVLTLSQMLEQDLAAERDARKESRGFVTPASAVSFLRRARSVKTDILRNEHQPDPETRSYFKSWEKEPGPVSASGHAPSEPRPDRQLDAAISRFLTILRDAEVIQTGSSVSLLAGPDEKASGDVLPLGQAIRVISRTQTELYDRLLKDISYLANTLIAGCPFKGRAFHPGEAADAALSTCNLGAEMLLKADNPDIKRLTALLEHKGLIILFMAGWRALFVHGPLQTAKTVVSFLGQLRTIGGNVRKAWEKHRLAECLNESIALGMPWQYAGKLDDPDLFPIQETRETLSGLIREYPILTGMLRPREARKKPYISSRAQLREIRDVLAKISTP